MGQCRGPNAGWKRISRHKAECKEDRIYQRAGSLPDQRADFLVVWESRAQTCAIDQFLQPENKGAVQGENFVY